MDGAVRRLWGTRGHFLPAFRHIFGITPGGGGAPSCHIDEYYHEDDEVYFYREEQGGNSGQQRANHNKNMNMKQEGPFLGEITLLYIVQLYICTLVYLYTCIHV